MVPRIQNGARTQGTVQPGRSDLADFRRQLLAGVPISAIAGAPECPPRQQLAFVRDALATLPAAALASIDPLPLHDWVRATLRPAARPDGTTFQVEDEARTLRLAWEILARLPATSQHFHATLSHLLSPGHVAFRGWLKAGDRQQFVPGLQRTFLEVLPQETPPPAGRIDFWRHRTAVQLARTGAHYVKGPHGSPLNENGHHRKRDDFAFEGALWNLLYQGDPDVHAARLVREGGTERLSYGHRDDARFGQYASEWKPGSPQVLAEWNQQLVTRLVKLVRLGYGYQSLTQLFHDREEASGWDPVTHLSLGCIDDFPGSLRHSNMRAGGWLADLALEHMRPYSPRGPTQAELARLITVQASQLALVSAWTAKQQTWKPEALAQVLRKLGGAWAHALGTPGLRFEHALPATLQTCALESLHAMDHLQGGTDLGHPRGVSSIQALFGYAETVAQRTVEALTA